MPQPLPSSRDVSHDLAWLQKSFFESHPACVRGAVRPDFNKEQPFFFPYTVGDY